MAGNGALQIFDLPKYADGKEITYTISEDTVDGYTPAYSDFNVTNRYTPEQTSVKVTKAWMDNNNQDGIRPESITVKLLANGQDTGENLVLSDGNNWTGTFTGLDKYQNGKEISYTVEEVTVNGYDTVITGDASTGFVITNSHTPATTEVSGSKTWDDADNQDGKRPDSITVKLYADGKDTGKELVLNQKNNWTGSFDNLDEYADGVKIIYTIAEAKVDGYDTAISGSAETGFVISNSHTPATPDTPDKPNTPTDPDEPKQTPGQSETPDTPKGDTPQTGDTTNLALWIGLLAISGTGLTATLVLGKKKRYRGKYIK